MKNRSHLTTQKNMQQPTPAPQPSDLKSQPSDPQPSALRSQVSDIQLAGSPATLTANNRAKLRFQSTGGRISALFDIDHSYLHSIRLVHALLDGPTRAKHPTPEDLADHIDDTGDTADSIFKAAFQTCNDAGWFLSPEELGANIAAAQADLDAPVKD